MSLSEWVIKFNSLVAVIPYGEEDPGHHWLNLWLVVWRHQVVTWTNVDFKTLAFTRPGS